MKTFLIFLICSFVVFAQVEQRADRMEKLIWWDLSSTATAAVAESDESADDDITVSKTDTIFAELYITDYASGRVIRSMNFVLDYGCYEKYKPSSNYSNSFALDSIIIDSTAMGIDTTGEFQYILDPLTKRFMFAYTDVENVHGMSPDTSIITLMFIADATSSGVSQILHVPLSNVTKTGYTMGYWTAILDKKLVPFSVWQHKATLKQ